MPFVSLTRLRIRSVRFLPGFALHTMQAQRQLKRTAGYLAGKLLADRSLTFWTMTAWDSEASMRAYMINGAHKRAMPHLLNWCDEASIAHWTQPEEALPSWDEADRRMRASGRISKVCHPSPDHANLNYRTPRTSGGVTL